MCVAFANATHIFFSKNISKYAVFNDQSFNNALTNGMVSFEQLGPEVWAQSYERYLQAVEPRTFVSRVPKQHY